MDAQKQELITRAERIRVEISQIFIDAGSWNENLRPLGEAKIDPDPDGELAKSAARIDRMLAQQGNEARIDRPPCKVRQAGQSCSRNNYSV